MVQMFKNQKNLEQFFRRKKLEKPSKHALFLLNIFTKEPSNLTVSIRPEDIHNAGLISNMDQYNNWKNIMISFGILISANKKDNVFKPSINLLKYISKEKNIHININQDFQLETKLQLEILKLQDEIAILKDALKETNRKIDRTSESWQLIRRLQNFSRQKS